jgi:D-alanyl-D-alanine dipeptidase
MAEIVLMGDARVARVPVRDCGDPLVDAREAPELTVAVHEDPGSPAYPFLRGMVVERLRAAQASLPAGLRLLLLEGYRPYELQRFYFDRHRRRLMEADPGLTEDAANLAASQFVSPPAVAPHVSGAAIDLTLVRPDDEPLDMGTPVDASPEESDGACYFAAENVSAEARHNRAVLADALEGAGLVNYPTEWWHWSFGDRYWALSRGEAHAVFGPVHTPPPTGPR